MDVIYLIFIEYTGQDLCKILRSVFCTSPVRFFNLRHVRLVDEQVIMRSIVRVISCLVIMLLASCASHKTMVKSSQELASCKFSCQQRLDSCNKVCHNNCRECSATSCRAAAGSYDRYKHEQCIKGGIVARNLNSYRDPLQCRKITCECAADYQVCIQSCAGVIHKRLQVASTCS